MRWFLDRSLTVKMLLVAVVMLAFASASAAVGYSRLSAVSHDEDGIYSQGILRLASLNDITRGFASDRAAARDLLTTDNLDAALLALSQSRVDREVQLEAYRPFTSQENFTALDTTYGTYWAQIDRIAARMSEGDVDAAAQVINTQLTPIGTALDALVDNEVRSAVDFAQTGSVADARQAERATLTLWLVNGTGAAVLLLLGMGVVWPITRKVAEIRRAAEGLARGDLTVRVPVRHRDEFCATADAYNRGMEFVVELLSGTVDVATAAKKVSDNVETVAIGAEQMRASIAEIAHNASSAMKVADEAMRTAAATTDQVARLEISSKEVGATVKKVNAISEKAELVGLNAAIEAAQAGEAGKGFTAVATEVKELARSSVRSTEDVAQHIKTIQSDTAGMADAISQIAAIIKQINDYAAMIESAMDEQAMTTLEMSRNTAEAAAGTSEIAERIAVVADLVSSSTTSDPPGRTGQRAGHGE